jgi:hypothetical protein
MLRSNNAGERSIEKDVVGWCVGKGEQEYGLERLAVNYTLGLMRARSKHYIFFFFRLIGF